MLVSSSRTDFFVEGGYPRGLIADLAEEYERHLNKGRSRKELRTDTKFVLVPFNRLIPDLLAGRRDIATGHLTVTPEREKVVEFIFDRTGSVNEVVAVHKGTPPIENLNDLSGRTVQVVGGSSHAEHLRRVNGELKTTGRKPIAIGEVSPFVTSEDLLELVNAGAVAVTVADDFRAVLWTKVLPDIRVLEDVVINKTGSTGWTVREGNPDLRDDLAGFTKTIRKGTLLGNTLHKRYYEQTKWITNPLADSERKKFEAVVELFKKYGTRQRPRGHQVPGVSPQALFCR